MTTAPNIMPINEHAAAIRTAMKSAITTRTHRGDCAIKVYAPDLHAALELSYASDGSGESAVLDEEDYLIERHRPAVQRAASSLLSNMLREAEVAVAAVEGTLTTPVDVHLTVVVYGIRPNTDTWMFDLHTHRDTAPTVDIALMRDVSHDVPKEPESKPTISKASKAAPKPSRKKKTPADESFLSKWTKIIKDTSRQAKPARTAKKPVKTKIKAKAGGRQ